MIVEVLIAILLGIIFGMITGLIPGIHINLVSIALLAISGFFLSFTEPIVLVVFIISMSIVHTFVDFIPSIFLGAPEENTVLSVLPGHKLLLEGKGYEAVMLSAEGSFFGLISLLVLTPLFMVFIPSFYESISIIIPFLLILASGYIIFQEKNQVIALILFIASGILGIASFNLDRISEPVFPLLTGLFGIASLIKSIGANTHINKQKITFCNLDKKEKIQILGISSLFSTLCAFLPGLGSSQAAVLSSQLKKSGEKSFLFMVGSVSTIVTGLNFAALYLINKTRSGTGIVVQSLIGNLTFKHFLLIIAVMIFTGAIAVIITSNLAKLFAINLPKISYRKINIYVLFLLLLMCLLISGWISILVLITSTALGLLAIEFGVRRINLMGCLILPTVLYFLV